MTHRVVSAVPLVHTAAGPTVELWVEAPEVARSWQPGQFVIVRSGEGAERIPLTIVDGRESTGQIRLVVQQVGKSTRDLVSLTTGGEIADVCGPLGQPSEISNFGTCVLVAGGYGSAAVLPIARALTEVGNRVIGIVGARTADLVILASEFAACVMDLHVMTDDGSLGSEGNVLVPLRELLDGERVDRVLAVGPIRMMEAVAKVTEPLGTPTVVSPNPIMVDGTGMCGACRFHANGNLYFACVDGPEFDAHGVDFDELVERLGTFRSQEAKAFGACGG